MSLVVHYVYWLFSTLRWERSGFWVSACLWSVASLFWAVVGYFTPAFGGGRIVLFVSTFRGMKAMLTF